MHPAPYLWPLSYYKLSRSRRHARPGRVSTLPRGRHASTHHPRRHSLRIAAHWWHTHPSWGSTVANRGHSSTTGGHLWAARHYWYTSPSILLSLCRCRHCKIQRKRQKINALKKGTKHDSKPFGTFKIYQPSKEKVYNTMMCLRGTAPYGRTLPPWTLGKSPPPYPI